jgi:hypothetical protein
LYLALGGFLAPSISPGLSIYYQKAYSTLIGSLTDRYLSHRLTTLP